MGKFGEGKFGEFGESSMIRQSKLVLTIKNLLADLVIRQTSFCQMLERVNSPNFPPAKLFRYTISLNLIQSLFNKHMVFIKHIKPTTTINKWMYLLSQLYGICQKDTKTNNYLCIHKINNFWLV